MTTLGQLQVQDWLAWCRRVEAILEFERNDDLARIARTRAATLAIATIEIEAISGERLALLLGPGDAAEAARRTVVRLDRISGKLCDLAYPPAGPAVGADYANRTGARSDTARTSALIPQVLGAHAPSPETPGILAHGLSNRIRSYLGLGVGGGPPPTYRSNVLGIPEAPKGYPSSCDLDPEVTMPNALTTDRLRADIDSGKAGDKVSFPDPAAVPLGTDDEAAGNPPSALQRQLAAQQELRPGAQRHTGSRSIEGFPWLYLALVVPLAAIIMAVVWLALHAVG